MEIDSVIERLVNMYQIIINIVSIEELDNLKLNKDFNKSYKAKHAIKKIREYIENIKFDLCREVEKELISYGENKLNLNDDIIVSCAKRNDCYLLTNDLNLKIKADMIGVNNIEINLDKNLYTGYKEVFLDEEKLSDFYLNLDKNIFNCNINEYLFIKNKEDFIDCRKWDGNKYSEIFNKKFSTEFFGKNIKAKDIYQRAAFDSIMTNYFTAISGAPGTGKSLISIIGSVKLIESGKYDRITILFNPTKTRGASDLGFYPGTQIEKSMQSNIGQMLISKFGDESVVMDWINNNKLKLISMADARGLEISNRDILYITEAQNTSVDLIKLCLSRVVEGCKVIIEGDYNSQLDNFCFESFNNGLLRVIDKFKDNKLFGYVDLKNVYRSDIAKLADLL